MAFTDTFRTAPKPRSLGGRPQQRMLRPQQPGSAQQQQPGLLGQLQGPMQVQTSIEPEGVFPERFTNQMGNLASAMAVPGRADLMAANTMAGVSSSSPMIQQNIGTDYAGALARQMMAGPQISMRHGLMNAQNILGQQAAREQEAQGWGRIGMQNQAAGLQRQGGLLGFLSSI